MERTYYKEAIRTLTKYTQAAAKARENVASDQVVQVLRMVGQESSASFLDQLQTVIKNQ